MVTAQNLSQTQPVIITKHETTGPEAKQRIRDRTSAAVFLFLPWWSSLWNLCSVPSKSEHRTPDRSSLHLKCCAAIGLRATPRSPACRTSQESSPPRQYGYRNPGCPDYRK